MGTNSESKGSTGQVSTTAAEVYEEFLCLPCSLSG